MTVLNKLTADFIYGEEVKRINSGYYSNILAVLPFFFGGEIHNQDGFSYFETTKRTYAEERHVFGRKQETTI